LENFREASSLRFQARLLSNHLQADGEKPVCPNEELALVLGLRNAESFRNQVIKDKRGLHADGRPRLIHKEAQELIQQVVMERYLMKDPIRVYEILDLLLDRFALPITLNTLKHHLKLLSTIKLVTGVAIEHTRAEVQFEAIKNWYR
jgi:hypothetical protein